MSQEVQMDDDSGQITMDFIIKSLKNFEDNLAFSISDMFGRANTFSESLNPVNISQKDSVIPNPVSIYQLSSINSQVSILSSLSISSDGSKIESDSQRIHQALSPLVDHRRASNRTSFINQNIEYVTDESLIVNEPTYVVSLEDISNDLIKTGNTGQFAVTYEDILDNDKSLTDHICKTEAYCLHCNHSINLEVIETMFYLLAAIENETIDAGRHLNLNKNNDKENIANPTNIFVHSEDLGNAQLELTNVPDMLQSVNSKDQCLDCTPDSYSGKGVQTLNIEQTKYINLQGLKSYDQVCYERASHLEVTSHPLNENIQCRIGEIPCEIIDTSGLNEIEVNNLYPDLKTSPVNISKGSFMVSQQSDHSRNDEIMNIIQSRMAQFWDDCKRDVEKITKVSADSLVKTWKCEGITLSESIERAFKDYADMFEQAMAVKEMFETEKLKWKDEVISQALSVTQNKKLGSHDWRFTKDNSCDYSSFTLENQFPELETDDVSISHDFEIEYTPFTCDLPSHKKRKFKSPLK